LAEDHTDRGTIRKVLSPSGREVGLLSHHILGVLQLAEGFGVAIVGHTTEVTVRHWLEITVAAERSVVLKDFLVAVTRTPNLIGVGGLGYSILNNVLINHFN